MKCKQFPWYLTEIVSRSPEVERICCCLSWLLITKRAVRKYGISMILIIFLWVGKFIKCIVNILQPWHVYKMVSPSSNEISWKINWYGWILIENWNWYGWILIENWNWYGWILIENWNWYGWILIENWNWYGWILIENWNWYLNLNEFWPDWTLSFWGHIKHKY